MSFASEVKKEILNIEDMPKCCTKALIFGLLQGTSEISIALEGIKLIIKSPILNAIKVMIPYLKEEYNIQLDERLQTVKNALGRRYYYLEIKENVNQIIKDFSLMPYDEVYENNNLIKKDCCKNCFVRGMFAVKGSINDPRKQCYHLEINCKKESVALTIQNILKEKDIESKIIMKGQNYLLYVKKSEAISDTLALIGASSGVFYFEDSRIYRDYVNSANRLTNCDVANARKTAAACEEQLAMIEVIRDYGCFDKMPIRLQIIAKMREEYPDSSLEELAEFSDKMFGKTMTKSGISHCMRDLKNYYLSLKIKEK